MNDLIARLRTQADYQREVGPTKHIMIAAADALADSVPRDQYDDAVAQASREKIQRHAVEEKLTARQVRASTLIRLATAWQTAAWQHGVADAGEGDGPALESARRAEERAGAAFRHAVSATPTVSLAEHDAGVWDACLDAIEENELNTEQARQGNPYRKETS